MDEERLLKDIVLYVRTGKIEKLASCMEAYKGDIDVRHGDYTLIGHAAALRQPESVRFLLEKGADHSSVCGFGYTPLLLAARLGNIDGVRHLLTAGADPNRPDSDGRLPLDHAVEMGEGEIVELLQPITVDPWGDADPSLVATVSPKVVSKLVAFTKQAMANGSRGAVQQDSSKDFFPDWYSSIVSSIPLTGIEFWCGLDVYEYAQGGRFLTVPEIKTELEDRPYLSEFVEDQGLCVFAEGVNRSFWLMKRSGTPRMKIGRWDESAMEVDGGFSSFSTFVSALTVEAED